MASRVYTAAELLDLRESQSSQALLEKVQLSPDLTEIMKAPGSNIQPRRAKKARDEVTSSTNSEDHIVFQGKKQTRDRVLTNGNGEAAHRGRTEPERPERPERPSNEPLPAPSGLAAQRSEGFRRFFDAVVSPTHVRVTAGGRIVPNTRASSSPTAVRWDREQLSPDESKTESDKTGASEPAQSSNNAQGVPMMAPMMATPMYPGFPQMFHPMGAPMPFFPGMPLAFGVPHSMAPTVGGMTAPQNLATQGQKNEPEDSDSSKSGSGQEKTRKPKPAPIKISPPEQFDQSRPFYHNGHVFYPPGASSAHLTGQMTTPLTTHSPYFSPGFASSRVTSFAQPSPVPSMISPGIPPTPYGPSPSVGTASAQQAPETTPQTAPQQTAESGAKPPITSIKPSEITKGHLSSLRSSLKYYEDQLQYNKHQIDEKWTRERVSQLSDLIESFEHNLKMQLKFEASYYPQQEKVSRPDSMTVQSERVASCQTPSRASSIKGIAQDISSQVASTKSANRKIPVLGHAQSMDQLRPRTRVQKAGINSTKGANTTAALDALEAKWNKARSHHTLPTGAAMAPPFEPRNMPHLQADVGSATDATVSTDSQWDQGVMSFSQQGLWQNLNLSSQFLSPGNISSETAFSGQQHSIGGGTTPYLIGKLPQGMNPHIATATDYQYSRELTDEEKRARHVYWGQVPSRGLGLPKFDGKDFYPPSPVKEAADKTERRKARRGMIPTGRPAMDYNFESSEPDNDPFRNRDTESIRSNKTGNKISRAVPIVDPETMKRQDVEAISKSATVGESRTAAGSVDEKKSTSLSRRAVERSSTKSSADLLQNMLKKGQTSGTAATSAVSSTTATGYLPQYFGHAAASLSPAIANANGPSTRASPSKSAEQDSFAPQPSMEKMGENIPPQEAPSRQDEIIADLHQRMLRDAERRGVIGPGWQ